MKKFLLPIVVASLTILSCKKENNEDAATAQFATYQGKYLVCDSIRTTGSGVNTLTIVGKGKGSDIKFGLYADLTYYTNPEVVKSFLFETPNKVYYWSNQRDNNVFYVVKTMEPGKLALEETEASTGRVIVRYYTPEK